MLAMLFRATLRGSRLAWRASYPSPKRCARNRWRFRAPFSSVRLLGQSRPTASRKGRRKHCRRASVEPYRAFARLLLSPRRKSCVAVVCVTALALGLVLDVVLATARLRQRGSHARRTPFRNDSNGREKGCCGRAHGARALARGSRLG